MNPLKRIYYLHSLALGVLLFAPVSSVLAQNTTGIIRGVIMERGTTNRLVSAGIYNKRTKGGVESKSFGIFEIGAVVGDTLVVYKEEYADAEVVVLNQKDLVIYLNRGTNLREVKITVQSKKQELNDIKQDFRDKGTFHEGKPPFLSYIFSPLTAIYELFGKTPKNARRFGKYAATELQQSEIDGLFNETMVKEYTPLQGKDLDYFMINYRPDYNKARKWAEYDSIKYIRDAYQKYTEDLKANPNLTNPNLDSLKNEILRTDSLKRIK